jgi:hypothetical protein
MAEPRRREGVKEREKEKRNGTGEGEGEMGGSSRVARQRASVAQATRVQHAACAVVVEAGHHALTATQRA